MPPSKITIIFVTTKGLETMDRASLLAGNFLLTLEHVVYPFDYPYHDVHAEVCLNGTRYSAVGLSPSPCVLTLPFHSNLLSLPCVETVSLPITDDRIAQLFLTESSKTPATYFIPIQDFLTPKAILDYTKPDLNTIRPDTWQHLYCSQYVLLFLRYCAEHGILPLPAHKLAYLHPSYINSRTCTPAHLRHIIDKMLT
jgi:hypothetical protein